MAEISFATNSSLILGQGLMGSGLGFYGASFGSSVQIGSYQSKTFITNSNGTLNGGTTYNTKYVDAASCESDVEPGTIPLSKLNGFYRTVDINFDHTTPVNVQNVQVRVYDRTNINYPATGVNTKIAEIVNFNGQVYNDWKDTPGSPNVSTDAVGTDPYGSGDHVWWGSPWPPEQVSQPWYDNSSGIRFYNGTDSGEMVNGDIRLVGIPGGDETVGGTGIIVPLLNSPGSGQRYLDHVYDPDFKPKWMQYYNSSSPDLLNIGSIQTTRTFGGTGVDLRHTWRLALSATPLSIGSKNYSMYVSLEYL